MSHCQKCGSYRIAKVGAKCSDLCYYQYDGIEKDGYVPCEMGIGGGDYIDFDYCLECGQIQDDCFPIKEEAAKEALEDN